MSKVAELTNKVSALPENIAAEVLDFLEFVAAKHGASGTKNVAGSVLPFRGSCKGRLSSSDDFAARKKDEFELEG